MKLTAVFKESKYGYIGYIEEIPGANTQGKTIEETKQNLLEAVQLVFEANREIAEQDMDNQFIIKENFAVFSI